MIKYAHQYAQTATTILLQYNGTMPLHHFLKTFFSDNKKFGSKDRKHISHLCYSNFRLGHALKHLPVKDRVAIVLYLSGADEWQSLYPANWQANLQLNASERMNLVREEFPFAPSAIFPFGPLSASIDENQFALSHLHQPLLFIRIRKAKEAYAKKKLNAANIAFEEIGEHALSFKNNTKLEDVLKINEDYVVQDINSQNVGELMLLAKRPQYMKVWDCCAASGGKSLLALDVLRDIHLTATDVRASIINNLKNRFQQAQVKTFTTHIVDVADANALQKTLADQQFDLVICDAPCSGSGTWGRTPEQLYYFTTAKVDHYTTLQKQVATNAIKYVKKGGYFLYITCSVFEQENEQQIAFLQENFDVALIKMQVLPGYEIHADTMFAALLQVH